MNFLDALAIGRPIRRTASHPNANPPWLILGAEPGNWTTARPVWRKVITGEVIGLRVGDYLATDWEVMP